MDSRTEGKLSKQTHEIMLSFDDTTQRKFLELFDGNHLTAIDEEFQKLKNGSSMKDLHTLGFDKELINCIT